MSEASTVDQVERKGHKARHAAMLSSASVEHTTPVWFLERVLETLGHIDLDPCAERACAVPAANHLTAADDGLAEGNPWNGHVFVNPPYGRAVRAWSDKFVAEYCAGRMSAGVLLVAARPDTRWFHELWRFPICFIRGRLKFGDATEVAPFPSAVVYAGPDVPRFHAAFFGHGELVASSRIWPGWPRQAERSGDAR